MKRVYVINMLIWFMKWRVSCQWGLVLELLLFLLFYKERKTLKCVFWNIFFLFLHLNLEILLKGTILKGSISTSAFGCPYVSLPRWLYSFGHHFLLVSATMLCPGLPSESLWHAKDSDCPGCFWIIHMSTLCLLPSLSQVLPHIPDKSLTI